MGLVAGRPVSMRKHRPQRVLSVECTVRRFFSSYWPNWPIILQLGSRRNVDPQTRPPCAGALNREYGLLA